MKAQQPTALVLRSEAVFHHLIPDLACRPIFGNLFEEIVMRVEKKAEPRSELVHVKPAPPRPFHILHAVVKSERQLLECGRACLANVISADRNSVETRRKLRPEFESIHY